MGIPLFDLSGRVVIITGGMGQLGRQFAQAAASFGAKIAVFDIAANRDAFWETVSTIPQEQIEFYQTDIVSRQSLAENVKSVAAQWNRVDGLINNAALDSPPNSPAEENGPLETYPEASWDQVMDVNVKGVLLSSQVIGGWMAANRGGSIINISSIYGMVSPDQRIYEYRDVDNNPFFKPVAYSASKSALFNMTRYMATYWARQNVRVNTVTFGGVYNHQDETFLRGYCNHVPLGRMAKEDEYNGAIVFLLSDASSYMTGSNMVIDGGWTAW